MEAKDYFLQIKSCSDNIFNDSIQNQENLGLSHHFINCIVDFTKLIPDGYEQRNWQNVTNELEASLFSVTIGMYRQAFTSLRLAFELGLGSILFSVEKISFYSWLQGEDDIKWSRITDNETGIFSERYLKAFFPQSLVLKENLKNSANGNYRELSEYVHGNHETWQTNGLKLTYNVNQLNVFFIKFKFITESLICNLFIRYIKDIKKSELEKLDFLNEILGHYDCIREELGGAINK